MTYQSSWGMGYATVITRLGGPAPCTIASSALACLIDPLLSVAPFIKSGYNFNAFGTLPDAAGLLNGFEVNAWPTNVQTTGVRAFCDDHTGVIRFVSPSVGPISAAAGGCAGVPTTPGVSGPVGN